MNIAEALTRSMDHCGWNITKVAAECGVTEGAVRKWLAGAEPRGRAYQRLRDRLPRFADFVDGKAVA